MRFSVSGIVRKLSLVQKFSAAAILLICVMTVTISVLFVRYQTETMREEAETNYLVIVQKLAKDAADSLILMDPLRLDELVQTTAQIPGYLEVGILDRRKRIVAHTDRSLLGQTVPLELQRQLDSVIREREEFVRDAAREREKLILVPVTLEYEVVGMVTARFSKDLAEFTVEQNIKRLTRYVLIVSGLLMFGGVWGSLWLARVLATPMKKLKDSMELVQRGNLDVEVPNEHVVNCWEAIGCTLRECPAYGRRRCWNIPGTLCFGEKRHIDAAEKIDDCKRCVVYRESCGDEVGELVEVFNQMVGDLRQNLHKLAEANDEKCRLERLSMLGQVAAGVAHEINNPLGGMKLCFNNLIDTEMDDGTKRQHVEVINTGFERIQTIVRQLLDFSKHSAITIAPSSLNSILENVLKLAEYTIVRKGIRIAKELSGDLPAVKADANKLEQVFLNLVINAMQAMDGNGGVLTLRTWREGARCAASVADTGTGIPGDIMPRIFDPFFTTKDVGQGTGLGLSVSKAIIEQHRGEIAVESSEAGTIFTVRVPVAP